MLTGQAARYNAPVTQLVRFLALQRNTALLLVMLVEPFARAQFSRRIDLRRARHGVVLVVRLSPPVGRVPRAFPCNTISD